LGIINKQFEPFSVRQKLFYHIWETKKLLSEEFKKQISHGIDGLIFQPVDDVILQLITAKIKYMFIFVI
jgi:mRNA-capping enzyme